MMATTPRRERRARVLLLVPFLLLAAAHASAQTRDTALARIDALLDAGQVARARDAIAQWNTAHPRSDTSVRAPSRAHALMIQARAAATWAEAEAALVAVAIGYPVTQHAPVALLRLGQGLLLQARVTKNTTDLSRAVAYLERLIADYPRTPLRAEGFLWLARAYFQTGNAAQACARIAQARRMQLDSLTDQLLEHEASACREPGSRGVSRRVLFPATAMRSLFAT